VHEQERRAPEAAAAGSGRDEELEKALGKKDEKPKKNKTMNHHIKHA
jgi:hypothetical protein